MRNVEQHEMDAWKAKYGDVFIVRIPVTASDPDSEKKVCYLKKPSRKALSYATATATKDPMKFNEILLNDCWIEGDEEIRTDDSYFLAVAPHLAGLISVKTAEVEKL